MGWCDDNGRDRRAGELAELQAAEHLQRRGYEVVRHPFGKTGPDLWTCKPGTFGILVEVRHKNPDKSGRYGLEHPKHLYWAAADIWYLIHDWEREGWFATRMRELPEPEDGPAGSYRSGEGHSRIPNAYWPAELWKRQDWEYEPIATDDERHLLPDDGYELADPKLIERENG